MNFKAIAKKQTTMAEIMIDREKITTQEIIDDFDGEITIDNIEFCHIGSDDVWAYTFEEDETKFDPSMDENMMANIMKWS